MEKEVLNKRLRHYSSIMDEYESAAKQDREACVLKEYIFNGDVYYRKDELDKFDKHGSVAFLLVENYLQMKWQDSSREIVRKRDRAWNHFERRVKYEKTDNKEMYLYDIKHSRKALFV